MSEVQEVQYNGRQRNSLTKNAYTFKYLVESDRPEEAKEFLHVVFSDTRLVGSQENGKTKTHFLAWLTEWLNKYEQDNDPKLKQMVQIAREVMAELNIEIPDRKLKL
jgi:hypothetical protein